MFYCLIFLSQIHKSFLFCNILWKTLWRSCRGLAKVLRCLSVCLLKDEKETSVQEHLLTIWPQDCSALPSRQRWSYSLTAADEADLSSYTSLFSSKKTILAQKQPDHGSHKQLKYIICRGNVKKVRNHVNARENIKGILYLISLQTLWEVVSKV